MIDEHQNGSHDDGELETPHHNIALKGQAQVALDFQMTTFKANQHFGQRQGPKNFPTSYERMNA